MQALLDTNFLLLPWQYKVDIFGELERLDFHSYIIFDVCIDELRSIASTSKRDARRARAALSFLESDRGKSIKTLHTNEKADKAIIEYALANGCAVATNDAQMIGILKEKKIPIIRLRQKKYLVVE